MSNLKYLLNHVTDVSQICEPLFKYTPISYFHCERYYKDGSIFCLTAGELHAKWFAKYVQKNMLVNDAEKAIVNVRKGVGLWSFHVPKLLEDIRNFVEISDPLSIIDDCGDFYEVCSFSAKRSTLQILDFYFNNIATLKKFILFFREKATRIIAKEDKKVNHFQVPKLPINSDLLQKRTMQRELLLQAIKVGKYSLQDVLNNKCITRRELDSLCLLLKGGTCKDIGNKLNISPKTVETHLNSVKLKLRCYSRPQLFDKAHKLGIYEIIEW